jgi:hypothetical protein
MSRAGVAVLKVVSGQSSVTDAAAEYGFSRRHLHRLLARYRDSGLDALEPRSPANGSWRSATTPRHRREPHHRRDPLSPSHPARKGLLAQPKQRARPMAGLSKLRLMTRLIRDTCPDSSQRAILRVRAPEPASATHLRTFLSRSAELPRAGLSIACVLTVPTQTCVPPRQYRPRVFFQEDGTPRSGTTPTPTSGKSSAYAHSPPALLCGEMFEHSQPLTFSDPRSGEIVEGRSCGRS